MFSTDAWRKCTTLGQCTKQLLLTCTGWCTNNHIHVSPSPQQWNCTQHKFCCCWQWLLDGLCPSFYDLVYLQYFPNAPWIDVFWALAFTQHFKYGCLWNGLEWNGKRASVLFPTLTISFSYFCFICLLSHSPRRLMMKWPAFEMMSSFALMTVQDRAIITTAEMGKP